MIKLLLTAALFTVATPTEPTITYTSDSVISEGISLNVLETSTEDNVIAKVVVDLPMGYTVYDDSSTDYVDGIKVNDEYLGSDYLIQHYDVNQNYTILVKTIYSRGISGIIASIQDGTYDYGKLFSNPVMIFQIIYYAIAIIAVIVSGILTSKSKKWKSITTADWQTVAENKMKEMQARTTEQNMKYFSENLMPLLKTILSNEQNIVKSIAISMNKDKNAPIAVLDILQEVSSNTDTDKIINEAKESLEEANKAKEEAIAKANKELDELSKMTESTETVKTDTSEGRY